MAQVCFPGRASALAAGLPTAHSKAGFNFVKASRDQVFVWPHGEGKARGVSIKPIHRSFPSACLTDEKLYTIASLIEMIRAGRAREKNLAAEKLQKMISEAS